MSRRMETAAPYCVLALAFVAAVLFSPSIVEKYLSRRHHLEPFTVWMIRAIQWGICPAFIAMGALLWPMRRPLDKVIEDVSGVACAVLLANLVIAAWINIRFPGFVLAHIENALHHVALRWLSGTFPYNDPVSRAVASIVYPPLYPAVVALLMRMFGVSPLIAKIAALAFALGWLAILAGVLRGSIARRGALLFGCATALALASPYYLLWARTDSLCALLSLLALALLARARKTIDYWLVVPVMVLAFYSKQTAVFLWLPALAVVALRRAPRSAWIAILVAYPLMLRGIGYVLDRISGGYYSFWTVELMGVIPLQSFPSLIRNQAPILTWMAAFPAFALCCWIFARGWENVLKSTREQWRDPRQQTWLAATFVGLPQLIVLSSRIGGGENSYLPVIAPLAVVSALWMDRAGSLSPAVKTAAFSESRFRWVLWCFSGGVLCLGFLLPENHTYYAIFYRARTQPAMIAELDRCIEEGPCRSAMLVRAARFGPDGEYEESSDISGYFAGKMIDGDEVTSFMDYRGAGFPTPPRIAAAVRGGEYPRIIAEKGFRPFDLWNHFYQSIPLEPGKRFLYSDEVRENFDRCYRKDDLGLRYFDAYRYRGGC